ncbi:hypothetical protein FQN54_003238 [Arachnomyces sp. PD_36]|nr:hypothetical protein FQN54_003238 [Arachnomyces sp. PD_36]
MNGESLQSPSHKQPSSVLQQPAMAQFMSPVRHAVPEEQLNTPKDNVAALDAYSPNNGLQNPSPGSPSPKHVAFELLLDGDSKRARIPMRVQIFPHDTTDSIVTTVKNFYGIYASGVSFEDESGNTLIARYENLRNNMTVYVRVIPGHGYEGLGNSGVYGNVPMDNYKRPSLGEPFQMAAPQPAQILDYGQSPSRPMSRVARKRSNSPSGRGRRSVSTQKASRQNGNKSRGSSTHGSFHDDAMAYSDSDGGHGSISGSRKARSEQFASSDISMENILQDGRRKRPKFDSSELPLFAPPQVPMTASTSSISPQRRSRAQEEPSPFARPAQPLHQPLPSPQSYGTSDNYQGMNSGYNSVYATPAVPQHGHRLRDRANGGPRLSNGSSGGILPTPDPTIASCISDEDVAMQLIRLGDASNFSHGRTSASTLDDAFSGAADASSSTGATSDGAEASDDDDDDELPPRSRQKLESSPMLPPGAKKRVYKPLDEILPSCDSSDPSCDEVDGDGDYAYDDVHDETLKEEEPSYMEPPKAKKQKQKPASSATIKGRVTKLSTSAKLNKTAPKKSIGTLNKAKTPSVNGTPKDSSTMVENPTPGSAVNFQHQLAADEEDLSTKPRCQRCRKSKKGCDRQRPCQRCKDAGIGIEGCVSEDEGNGRKGRYGRHMGVPVKKATEATTVSAESRPSEAPSANPAPILAAGDKSKKRKR